MYNYDEKQILHFFLNNVQHKILNQSKRFFVQTKHSVWSFKNQKKTQYHVIKSNKFQNFLTHFTLKFFKNVYNIPFNKSHYFCLTYVWVVIIFFWIYIVFFYIPIVIDNILYTKPYSYMLGIFFKYFHYIFFYIFY